MNTPSTALVTSPRQSSKQFNKKMGRENGELVYKIYRALTYTLSPMINLHLRWRKFRGLEHPLRWRERLGRSSLPRPPGPLVWFHAVSLGEGMAAIPVINRCVQQRPDFTVLMTTTTASAFNVIKDLLPNGVLYQSTMQAIRFQLLQASPSVINFCGDLKFGIEEFYTTKRDVSNMEDLQVQLSHRHVWLAASIHSGEEKVILGAHEVLKQMHPDIVTIIVPRHPQLGQKIAHDLQKEGVSVALRSRHDTLMPGTSIYVVDTLGELRHFYRLAPIAVIGGSFLSSLTGHNISEAAAAGCAVLTGHHVGHFSHMAMAMRRLNPLSVQQVAGRVELEVVLHELLSNAEVLEARRAAAKQAFHALSHGVIENVWNLLHFHVFSKELMNQRLEQQS